MNAEPLLPPDAAAPAPAPALGAAGDLPPRSARDGTLGASPSPRGTGEAPDSPPDGGGDGAPKAGGAGAGAHARPAGAAGADGAGADDDDLDATGGAFDCNVCYDVAREPVVTLCGHLYCWPCLYRWMQVQSHCRACPVCKAGIDEDRVIPIYGRGGDHADPRKLGAGPTAPAGKGDLVSASAAGAAAAATATAAAPAPAVPRRPAGQHTPATPAGPAPPAMPHLQPGLGLIPTLFGLGPAAGGGGGGIAGVGYGGGGGGGGGSAAAAAAAAAGLDLTPEQQHQAFLSRLLLMLGSFVIMCLLLF